MYNRKFVDPRYPPQPKNPINSARYIGVRKKLLPKLKMKPIKQKLKPINKQEISLSQKTTFQPLKMIDHNEISVDESMISMNVSFYDSNRQINSISIESKKNSQKKQKDFEERYTQVLSILTELQKDQKVKELINEVQSLQLALETRYLILEWENQDQETQNLYQKETLILGIINLFFENNEKIKLEVFQTCLQYFTEKATFFKLIKQRYNDKQQTSQIILASSNNTYDDLDTNDFSRLFLYTLTQGVRLSKKKSNDIKFINQKILKIYMSMIKYYLGITDNIYKLSLYLLYIFEQVFIVLKNISGNDQVRKYLFSKKYILVILQMFDFLMVNIKQQDDNPEGVKVLSQITGLFRNLAIDKYAFKKLCQICEQYQSDGDFLINTIKTLSKLSVFKECCEKIFNYKKCMKIMTSLFLKYKKNVFLMIRLSYILANMTSHIESMRDIVYFDFKGFTDIYECFNFYYARDIGKENNEELNFDGGQTYSSFEFHKAKNKETESDVLTKLLRLIANLFTLPKIGKDVMTKKPKIYRNILVKMGNLLTIRKIGEKNEQILCILSSLANVTFYEKFSEKLAKVKSLIDLKTKLLSCLAKLLIQIQSEEICCETLRVLCNIVKDRRYMKPIVNLKILEAVVVLLNHNSREIVYFALGILINMMLHEPIKKRFGRIIFQETVKVLNDCSINDVEIICCCLKVILNTFINCQIELQQKFLNALDKKLSKIGDDCDIIINEYGQTQQDQIQEIINIRKMINQVINNTPEISFKCKQQGCNRKFKTKEKLQDHMERRHKNNEEKSNTTVIQIPSSSKQ